MTNKITFVDTRHYNKDAIKAAPDTPQDVETAFVALLENRCNQDGTVKPLSISVFERIERLKAKAEEARQRQEHGLLEG
jgi:hypothetical protein